MYYVYIIKSQKTGSYYIGSSSHVDLRVERHNGGWTKSTKNKGPWSLVYREEIPSKSAALKREKQIKLKKSRIYIEKLISKTRAEVVPI